MTALAALFRRDLALAARHGGGAGLGVLFFLIVAVLTPFAVGPDPALLSRIGPAILWLGALLASLLGLDRLLAADAEDGSLDLLTMTGTPLELAMLAKAAAHWLTTGLPLAVAAPFVGLFFNLDASAGLAVALTLLAGTPALTFLGLTGAALAVALSRGGLLIPILILPLAVPVLIFGVSAAQAMAERGIFNAAFLVLCALSLGSAVIGCAASAAALRPEEN